MSFPTVSSSEVGKTWVRSEHFSITSSSTLSVLPFFSFPSRALMTLMLALLLQPHRFLFIFSVCFHFVQIWSFLLFCILSIDYFLHILNSVVEPIHWGFYVIYCIFWLEYSHLVLFFTGLILHWYFLFVCWGYLLFVLNIFVIFCWSLLITTSSSLSDSSNISVILILHLGIVVFFLHFTNCLVLGMRSVFQLKCGQVYTRLWDSRTYLNFIF